jgi:hypothetical protein
MQDFCDIVIDYENTKSTIYSRRREVVKKRGGYGSFLKILRFRFDKKFNFVE